MAKAGGGQSLHQASEEEEEMMWDELRGGAGLGRKGQPHSYCEIREGQEEVKEGTDTVGQAEDRQSCHRHFDELARWEIES